MMNGGLFLCVCECVCFCFEGQGLAVTSGRSFVQISKTYLMKISGFRNAEASGLKAQPVTNRTQGFGFRVCKGTRKTLADSQTRL